MYLNFLFIQTYHACENPMKVRNRNERLYRIYSPFSSEYLQATMIAWIIDAQKTANQKKFLKCDSFFLFGWHRNCSLAFTSYNAFLVYCMQIVGVFRCRSEKLQDKRKKAAKCASNISCSFLSFKPHFIHAKDEERSDEDNQQKLKLNISMRANVGKKRCKWTETSSAATKPKNLICILMQ